jgi:hypothetical protein
MVTISKKSTKLVLPKEYEADTKVNIRFPLPSNRPLLLYFEKNMKLNQFAWKPKSIRSSALNCGERNYSISEKNLKLLVVAALLIHFYSLE